jgi:hypothetical protein
VSVSVPDPPLTVTLPALLIVMASLPPWVAVTSVPPPRVTVSAPEPPIRISSPEVPVNVRLEVEVDTSS